MDGRGNIYLNGADFNFVAGEAPKPGYINLVTRDGGLRQVADDIQFPNGMVVTPDNRTLIISESFAGRLTAFDIDPGGGLSNRRVFADGLAPDGICLDADGAVWTSSSADWTGRSRPRRVGVRSSSSARANRWWPRPGRWKPAGRPSPGSSPETKPGRAGGVATAQRLALATSGMPSR